MGLPKKPDAEGDKWQAHENGVGQGIRMSITHLCEVYKAENRDLVELLIGIAMDLGVLKELHKALPTMVGGVPLT